MWGMGGVKMRSLGGVGGAVGHWGEGVISQTLKPKTKLQLHDTQSLLFLAAEPFGLSWKV